jgi:opacity protein-like surface antigen
VYRLILVALVLSSSLARSVAAQDAEPYVLGDVGGSFGDGGSAPAVALGFGYLTPHRVGFEIEVSYVPDLDFGDPGFPRIAIFPPITIQSTGRLVGLQTHVVGVLPGSGTKLRAFVLGGGGIADVEQRIRFESPLALPDLGLVFGRQDPSVFGPRTSNLTQSETSLLLSAGAGVEYALTQHFGLGMSVRYQHVFSDPRELDLARAGARVIWRF